VQTLRNRTSSIDAETPEEADELGRRAVLDIDDAEENLETFDAVAGSDFSSIDHQPETVRNYLLGKAREIERLSGPDKDNKLAHLIEMVKQLIADGHNPIVFCRFIPTASYVAEHLRKTFKDKVAIDSVTGQLPAEERQDRVTHLGNSGISRILVATDCLSEGVNLQEHFDAVIHYDLSWNPTRHEQREGRVDRYGQPRKEVRAITYYGADNGIDQIVLDVLHRKSAAIRKSTGVMVPVPDTANVVLEDLLKRIIQNKGFGDAEQLNFELFDEEADGEIPDLHLEWENASEKEKRSRHMFAQHAIKPDDVQREIERVRTTLGTNDDLHAFLLKAIPILNGQAIDHDGTLHIDLSGADRVLIEAAPRRLETFTARVELPVQDGEIYLFRTHQFVETIAARIIDAAIHPTSETNLPRNAASHADHDKILYLVRHRVLLTKTHNGEETSTLAEHCEFLAANNFDDTPEVHSDQEIGELLDNGQLSPLDHSTATELLGNVLQHLTQSQTMFSERSERIAQQVKDDHQRVRDAARQTGLQIKAKAVGPPDILAVFVLSMDS
jgi:hypothetical protein